MFTLYYTSVPEKERQVLLDIFFGRSILSDMIGTDYISIRFLGNEKNCPEVITE